MRSDSWLNCTESCPKKYDDLSFEDWKDLYESEPERFEKYRLKLLNDLVDTAPERSKARLNGLIFQMDAEARRAKSPMAYNLRLAVMMREMLGELSYHLSRLASNDSKDMEQDHASDMTATILSFNQTCKTGGINQ